MAMKPCVKLAALNPLLSTVLNSNSVSLEREALSIPIPMPIFFNPAAFVFGTPPAAPPPRECHSYGTVANSIKYDATVAFWKQQTGATVAAKRSFDNVPSQLETEERGKR